MRMHFTTLHMSWHFHPLIPIARAAVAAGHDVAFACGASFVSVAERAGFRAFSAGFDDRGRSIPELFPGFFKKEGSSSLPNIFVGVYAVR